VLGNRVVPKQKTGEQGGGKEKIRGGHVFGERGAFEMDVGDSGGKRKVSPHPWETHHLGPGRELKNP